MKYFNTEYMVQAYISIANQSTLHVGNRNGASITAYSIHWIVPRFGAGKLCGWGWYYPL